MATWQADFDLVLPPQGLVHDYRDRLAAMLPPLKSWSDRLEQWGTEDGDRIDVWSDGRECEVFVRFDMRAPKAELYRGFPAVVQASGCVLASQREERVEPTVSVLVGALRRAAAARFVADPIAFLEELERQR